jgi:hypothetical protein
MVILGANRSLATLDMPRRMSTASKLFAPNLDKRQSLSMIGLGALVETIFEKSFSRIRRQV